jgi:hypothetical protein
MKEFNRWFNLHGLDRFYIDNCFNLDNTSKLEEELNVNINFYTLEPELSLYYRSEYKQSHDEIYNLVIVPMTCFYDNNKKVVPAKPKKMENGVTPVYKDNNFIARINIKEMINKVNAHCCVLDSNYFKAADSAQPPFVIKGLLMDMKKSVKTVSIIYHVK